MLTDDSSLAFPGFPKLILEGNLAKESNDLQD